MVLGVRVRVRVGVRVRVRVRVGVGVTEMRHSAVAALWPRESTPGED